MTIAIIITPTNPPITPPYRTLDEDLWIAVSRDYWPDNLKNRMVTC
jgi:hypothetical protein